MLGSAPRRSWRPPPRRGCCGGPTGGACSCNGRVRRADESGGGGRAPRDAAAAPPASRWLDESLRTYGVHAARPNLHGPGLVAGLAMASVFAYVLRFVVRVPGRYGLSDQEFGLAFGAGAVGLIAATQVNGGCCAGSPPSRSWVTGLAMGTTAGAALVVAGRVRDRRPRHVLASLLLLLASAGLVMPNAPALAMSGYGESAARGGAARLGPVRRRRARRSAGRRARHRRVRDGVVVAGCMVAANRGDAAGRPAEPAGVTEAVPAAA